MSAPILTALGLAALVAAGQAAEDTVVDVRGRVIEVGTGRPVAAASLAAAGQEVRSDEQGRFRLSLPPGVWTIDVRSAGHLDDRVEVAVGGGPQPELQVLLVERDRFRETVEVAAEPDPPAGPPPLPIRPIDVLSQAGVADNVFRSLQTLAGVAAVNEFDSRLAVRGGGPDQNLTVMDGVEIHDPYRLFGLTSAFNPETVSAFELTSGAFDVRFGDRLSSLLQVQNRTGTSQRPFAGSGSLSVTDANLVFEGDLPGSAPGTWLVTGRRTYYDLVAERVVDDDLPSFADLQAKLDREIGPGRRLTFTGLVSREGTDGSFADDEERERADVVTRARNGLASLAFDTPLGASAGSARTVAAWSRFTDSIDFDGRIESDNRVSLGEDGRTLGLLDVIFRRDVEVEDLSLRQELVLLPAVRHRIETGFELHGLRTRWAWEIPGDRNPSLANGSSVQGGAALPDLLDSQVDSTRFGVWLADRFQVTPRLTVEPGLRLDRSGLIGRSALAPRIAVRFEVSPATRLRLAGGLHSQSPGYEKLYQADYFVDLSGASGLEYERALHVVLGLERELAPGLTLRAEGYYKGFRDLVVGRLETEEERRARVARYDFPRELAASVPVEPEITSFPVNGASGRAWGLDVHLTRRPASPDARLVGRLSWAWGRADRDAYGRRYPFDYDRRHSVDLVATWRLGRKLDLGVTARWASGFPYTPARGVRAVAAEDPLDSGGLPRLVPERDDRGQLVWGVDPGGVSNLNAARLPPFARLDARLTFRPRGPAGRWLFYLEVINALDRKNAARIEYDIRFDPAGEPFIASDVRRGGVPLLPTFGARFRF